MKILDARMNRLLVMLDRIPQPWFYTFKSIALVAVVAALAYYIGKSSRT